MTRAAVFGSGNWGTAFGMVLADAGTEVTLWGRRADLAEAINVNRENPDYLPGITLPDGLSATTDPATALEGADFALLAVPSQTLRANLSGWAAQADSHTVFVSLMKGVELGTCMRMSEVIAECTGAGPDRIAVISGPNLAHEIARRMPAGTVVASAEQATAERLQKACHTPYVRPYTSNDVIGCELGGAVKNVIGLAAGMADGMGLGDNAKSTLITRGLAETTRLGVAVGADPYTFAGLAGLGDVVATCGSSLSRNHMFGVHLGRGLSVTQASELVRETAEGVKSCESVLELAERHGVDMPIARAVVGVVHDGHSPKEMLATLMARSAKSEALY
ncbi:NAD(P)-dependent glycerol-3-phosphate dehydrogenase [Actinospica durhamensis]|uniref:Glycerol-3-phosphate dehydrogenase [NAD(P)+] n=1 Tax=Actinospica durhamensis TaxID=1508375 RepID=A0A941ELD1_9ACTN|nr:NAD(P)H-dependent glycerol-3-phosphate dehydrogenase [Actinospica durhamensis]MBR7833035.1 NAD(P)-dependent glycerol-3-phosphate dehydrogenase [Actinospica durhamensis]